MTTQPATDQEAVVRAVYQHAADMMRQGKNRHKIIESLTQKGLDQESANVVVTNLENVRKQHAKSGAGRDMAIGALICAVGVVITIVTYSAASAGGGRYVVAYGAIVVGAIQFLRGLFNTFVG